MNKLAEIVKGHRKLAKLTQRELADLAGVGKTVIFDIEHGKESLRLDTLLKVLRTLNIKIVLKGPMSAQELEW